MLRWFAFVAALLTVVVIAAAQGAPPAAASANAGSNERAVVAHSRGDRMIAAYFASETAAIERRAEETLRDWPARREARQRELLDMLGLAPMPPRTPLGAVVTGRIERDGIVVEKLHFQSRPRLYVTANLYLPAKRDKPVPAVLYLCGHGQVKLGGVSYGNKVYYQHHGAWLARHGFACLTIDSLQLGEIEGIHHGTYREKMWWWANRGYTPAGVEALNCLRAVDYLASRKEVDAARIGATGRSGGGAYSWWIAAIDPRIRAAVPVAGITDLRNHVVDGCVEGHCDCMYLTNTYRWDYSVVAAMVAPRALLIGNSDHDNIFPLDGVVRTHAQVARVYERMRASGQLGLNIVWGPHEDCQELQVPAFRWFLKHLKGDAKSEVDEPAVKRFTPQELRVFAKLPADAENARIHESFVPEATLPAVPQSADAWRTMASGWREALRTKTFCAWPEQAPPLELRELYARKHGGLHWRAYDFTSQQIVGESGASAGQGRGAGVGEKIMPPGGVRLRLYRVQRDDPAPLRRVVMHVLDQAAWRSLAGALHAALAAPRQDNGSAAAGSGDALMQLNEPSLPPPDAKALGALADRVAAGECHVYVAPRGVGPMAWDPSEKKQTQIRRRFLLLGQTLEGMQVWDIRRALAAVRELDGLASVRPELAGSGAAGGIALWAAVFEPDLAGVELERLPPRHRDGPTLLNVARCLDTPQAVALAAEHCPVRLVGGKPGDWEFPLATARTLGWGERRVGVTSATGPASD